MAGNCEDVNIAYVARRGVGGGWGVGWRVGGGGKSEWIMNTK